MMFSMSIIAGFDTDEDFVKFFKEAKKLAKDYNVDLYYSEVERDRNANLPRYKLYTQGYREYR